MALLEDEGWVRIEDLAEEDSGILELSQREGVDLAAKIRLAVSDVRAEADSFLRAHSVYSSANGVVDWQVRRWAIHQSLSSAYRDAYFQQLNDRYGSKWKLYVQQAKDAREQCLTQGIGVVLQPLPRPRAPEATLLTGLHGPRSYWFAITWTGANGQTSTLGEPRLVQTTGLHQVRVESGQSSPPGAKWHIYAGSGPGEMTRQTSEALPAEGAWLVPEEGLVEGDEAPQGQRADQTVRRRRLLGRRRPVR
jgi:hypothetical protein